jgi:hypothetical protein
MLMGSRLDVGRGGSWQKVKLSLKQAAEAQKVVRRRDSHSSVHSQMAVRSSALRAGRPLPSGRFLVLISVRG